MSGTTPDLEVEERGGSPAGERRPASLHDRVGRATGLLIRATASPGRPPTGRDDRVPPVPVPSGGVRTLPVRPGRPCTRDGVGRSKQTGTPRCRTGLASAGQRAGSPPSSTNDHLRRAGPDLSSGLRACPRGAGGNFSGVEGRRERVGVGRSAVRAGPRCGPGRRLPRVRGRRRAGHWDTHRRLVGRWGGKPSSRVLQSLHSVIVRSSSMNIHTLPRPRASLSGAATAWPRAGLPIYDGEGDGRDALYATAADRDSSLESQVLHIGGTKHRDIGPPPASCLMSRAGAGGEVRMRGGE
jgi:hypothetical protein